MNPRRVPLDIFRSFLQTPNGSMLCSAAILLPHSNQPLAASDPRSGSPAGIRLDVRVWLIHRPWQRTPLALVVNSRLAGAPWPPIFSWT